VADVSDVFLVRGSLQLLGAEPMISASETTTLFLFATSAGTSSWKAPQDYFVCAVAPSTGTNQSAVTLDGSSYTTNFAGAGNKKLGAILYLGGLSTDQPVLYQRTKVKKDQTITMTNNSASSGCFTLVLEPIN
jgi:hypothetical protein